MLVVCNVLQREDQKSVDYTSHTQHLFNFVFTFAARMNNNNKTKTNNNNNNNCNLEIIEIDDGE